MTALSITAAQVLPAANCPTVTGVAGEAITQGQAVYLSTSGTWLKAQCDGTAAEAGSEGYGLALTAAGGVGQPVVVALPGGTVTLGAGAAPAASVPYFIGASAGDLVPLGDLSSTNKVTPICFGVGSNKVKILTGAYDAGSVKG